MPSDGEAPVSGGESGLCPEKGGVEQVEGLLVNKPACTSGKDGISVGAMLGLLG